MKQLIPILICLYFWLMTPAIINAEPVAEEIDSPATEESVQSLKTEYLFVLGGAGRREIKINPPATKIVITYQSGDTAIRCGDEQNTYICSPGKRLELEYEVTTPLVKFWAENINDVQVRLKIDVYQTVPLENCSPNSGQNNEEGLILSERMCQKSTKNSERKYFPCEVIAEILIPSLTLIFFKHLLSK